MVERHLSRIYEFEGFRLDAVSAMLYHNEQEVALPPKAIETLLALVERSGEIVPKVELMKIIWSDSIVEESNLSQYLHLLRKTLGTSGEGKPFIETLKRRGYRFNPEVAVRSHPGPLPGLNRTKELVNEKIVVERLSNRALRVERQGNVLALADWQESDTDRFSRAKTAERPDDVLYPDLAPKRRMRLGYLVTVFAALLLAVVWFTWRYVDTPAKGTTVKSDLSFLSLTSGEDVKAATISPDGNYFVYASHEDAQAHLWLQQTGHPNRLAIISPFAGSIYGTTFTPDSQYIYFVAKENAAPQSALYRVPALGGVFTKILSEISSPVSFSPDGRELVFIRWDRPARQTSLVIASSDGTSERVLLTRTGDDAIDAGGGAWSPDGSLIAFGALQMGTYEGRCTISGIDPQTAEIKMLSAEKWDGCARMAWTSDGSGLVFGGTKFRDAYSTRRDQIYYLSVNNGESRRLTTDFGSRHQSESLGITNTGEVLVVPFNRLSQIWAMDAGGDSRTAVQITKGFADGRGGIAPLADGRVAYLTRNGDGFSIWLMNGDGTGGKQLTTDPPEIEELRSDPDGKFFVFSAKRDDWSHLYRVDAAGRDLTQLTFGESQELDSTVSPDGNWIVYTSTIFESINGTSAVWKISPAAGGPVRLTDEVNCQTPHFSPDGKMISCVSEDWRSILILSAENGTTLKTFRTVDNSVLNIGSRWTPDGKALTYIVNNKNAGNIWLQPIDVGDARPLTDFSSGEIYNYAFSSVGSRLYVARGYSTHNAVLIKNFR